LQLISPPLLPAARSLRGLAVRSVRYPLLLSRSFIALRYAALLVVLICSLFEMGFAAQINEILKRMGEAHERQTALFSATMPKQLVSQPDVACICRVVVRVVAVAGGIAMSVSLRPLLMFVKPCGSCSSVVAVSAPFVLVWIWPDVRSNSLAPACATRC
jgi:hypothetical protein